MDSLKLGWKLLLVWTACVIAPVLANCPTEFRNCTCLHNTLTCSLKKYLTLPESVSFDLTMTYYHFDHNNLTVIKSTYFENFISMSYLSLRENSISTIEEESFHHNTELTHIDLSYNLLEFLPIKLFSRLTVLTNIYLGNNRLKRIESNHFMHLTNLEVIRMNDNKLTYIGSDAFINSHKLRELYLESNLLEIPEKNWLKSFNTTAKEYFVYLDDNPWSCDCRMKEFYLWGKNHPWFNKHDSDGISVPKCHSPDELVGISLAKIPEVASLHCSGVKVTLPTREIKATAGEEVELSCSADGYPYPSVSIYKVDKPGEILYRMKNKVTLKFPEVKLSDSGMYVCNASGYTENAVSTFESETYKLTVSRTTGNIVTIVFVSLFSISALIGVFVWFYRRKYGPKAAYGRLPKTTTTTTHYDASDVAASAMYNAESIHQPPVAPPVSNSLENRYNQQESDETDDEDVVAEYAKDTEFLV